VGIDLDIAALRDHTAHRSRLQASAVSLPFSSCAFDLVTSNMVFEHLDRPWDALAEIRRVLRPGGRLIVHTPNLFDIVSLAAWTIPSSLHARLVSAVETRTAEDVYPTYFRFNYRPRIRGWLGMAGFRRCQVSYLECPDVYGHVPVVARVESIWHTVARHVPALRGTVLIDATV
jgi:ubiquinone/menaquinone biosynthesis C-methylase UbiE